MCDIKYEFCSSAQEETTQNKREERCVKNIPFTGRAARWKKSVLVLPAFRVLKDRQDYQNILSTFGKSWRGFIVLQQDRTFPEALFLAADRKFIPILQSSSQFVPGSFFFFPLPPISDGRF